MTLPIATEQVEQMRFVQWLDIMGYKYTSIPNSTFTRSWKQKQKNTQTGLRAGFPDMVVIAKNIFMCVEMKRTKGGVISTLQKEWIRNLQAANIPTGVCYGADEAIAFVKEVVSRAQRPS